MKMLTENSENLLGFVLLASAIIGIALLFNILFDKKE